MAAVCCSTAKEPSLPGQAASASGRCQHHKYVVICEACIAGCSLVSSDDAGAVCLWEAASASSYTRRHALVGHGTPCVALAVRGETVVAAFQDGVVRLHDMVSSVVY